MGSLYHRDESRGWPRGEVTRDGWISLKDNWDFVSHLRTSDDRESQSKKLMTKPRVRSREIQRRRLRVSSGTPPLPLTQFN